MIELFSWVPLPYFSPARCLFPMKISCFFSTCVSWDNSFLSVRQEPSFRPWKGSPFLQQMATLVGTFLHWDWHLDHSGYSGASLPAHRPDPAVATGILLSLVSSWHGQLARVPWPGKEQETLLICLLLEKAGEPEIKLPIKHLSDYRKMERIPGKCQFMLHWLW